MYTEEDLRATFGALEEQAPDGARVLAGVEQARRRRTTRRRTVGMLAAAAFVAVAAVGSIVVAPDRTPPASDVSADLERLRFPFAVDDIPGYAVNYRFLNFSGYSSAWIAPPTASAEFPQPDANKYDLMVFTKGRYDPTADQSGGQPVRVNGKSGFYRGDMRCQCSSYLGIPGVVWEYAPDSWAMVQYQPAASLPSTLMPADVREVVLRIADAVRFDRTTPMPVPFQVGYLPAGLRPAAEVGDVNTVVHGGRGTMIQLADGSRSLTISGMELGGLMMMEIYPTRTTVTVDLGQFDVRLIGTGFSEEELNEIAHTIKPAADISDPSTWFDADKVIPLN